MRILSLLSGGVDSTVASLLLKDKGYDVIGLHLDITNNKNLLTKIEKISQIIGIKLIIKDISPEFNQKIIKYFIDNYLLGKTPNPCMICNHQIKLKYALNIAKELVIDAISTGHYAKIIYENNLPFIKKASDQNKDQSYFLAYIPQNLLKYIHLPLENLTKEQVKKIAIEKKIDKLIEKESQDICFLKQGYREFLKNYINEEKKGIILDIYGKKIGFHNGLFNFTIGQRSGIGIPSKYPLYVKKIDYNNNTIIVAPREYLYESTIKISNLNLFKDIDDLKNRIFDVKIRYRHPSEKAIVSSVDNQILILSFIKPVFAPTPGQFAVLYEDDKIVACGEIC